MSSMPARVVSRGALAILASAAMAIGTASPAAAHDVVIGGDPADGDNLAAFPSSVTLEFSGIPREGFNTFAISNIDSGEILYTGEPTINERRLSLDLPADLDPGDGHYRIGFQITSSDGHATRGMTTFSVGEAPEPSTDSSADTSSEDAPVIALGAGAAGIGLVAMAIALVIRRRGSHTSTRNHTETTS